MFKSSSLLYILYLCTLFGSCTQNQKKVPIITVHFDNSNRDRDYAPFQYPDDSVKRDIPRPYRDKILRNERKKLESALQIGTLENGFAGEQIRVIGNEYEEYKDGWARLLLVTNQSSWTATLYYIRIKAQDDFTPIVDTLQYQRHVLSSPKSGWKAFMDSVNNYGLFTLPHYSTVPGYGEDLDTDERSYVVEIGRPSYYRLYGYPGPIGRAKKFSEANRFTQLIKFIKEEFVFPAPYTPEK